ncbi:unnamed protein product [Adineta steineri]|uniref:Homeobox domain-containing protein n=1 Tax=Adineta steineri TaxID=433720 RepID=A0A818XD08_9BILA|nr:unnamed protein product [Adineta steineri]CAF3737875.1 unnamed protein product [Adineta steineri]
MDRSNKNDNFAIEYQQNSLLEMMKQHISSGLPFHYETNHADQIIQHHSDEDTSSNLEHDENEQIHMPIMYKKRVRVKFSQEQLDALETTFQQHRYPTIDMIDDLVEQLNLPTQKITVWFQNRRARLKKSQQKNDNHQSFERDEQQYDSGIHLDEDISRSSSTSPPSNVVPYVPPTGYIPSPSPYYLPNPHQTYYNSFWQNYGYQFQPTPNSSYDYGNYNSPFVFQDIGNYQP